MNVYDFDNTIYHGESGVDLFKYFLKRDPALVKKLPWAIRLITDYKLTTMTMDDVIHKYAGVLEKYGREKIGDLDELAVDFWDKHSYKVKPMYFQMRQDDDVIISACLDFILKEICERLNIKNYIGSEVDAETKSLISFCYKDNKVKAFRKHYPGQEIDNLYTDSFNDQPLMDIAKNVYLVKGNKIKKIK